MAAKNGSAWSASSGSDGTPSASQKSRAQHAPTMAEGPSKDEKDATSGGSDADRKTVIKPQATTPDQASQEGALGRSLQAQLGRQLRTIFADVAEEPVPERFRKLLDELEAREKRR